MVIIGNLLKKGIRLRDSIQQEFSTPFDLQKSTLRKLMIKARRTQFGQRYSFSEILKSFRNTNQEMFYENFKEKVPTYDYSTIFKEWWHKTREDEKNVCWPGQVKYFALSSGTSEATSKYIPVTRSMMKAIQRTGVRQILSLSKFDLPAKTYEKGMLMLGGSTELNRHGTYFEGDLSGITTGQLPFWLHFFYKPGQRIARTKDWDLKLNEIVLKAKDWDIGYLMGVPAWIQILMEKIIKHYEVDNIHEIWPNLEVYVHGGVSLEPYRKSFDKLLGRPITYIETYLASEGFIAFQALPDRKSMRLVLNNGIFYEFVPFTSRNFDDDGQLVADPETYMIHEIDEQQEYALLISTCAGAWRYLIGDTIRFVNKYESEIVITGRTKHFLSLCGEHLSVDNMTKAVEMLAEEFDISIREFTVAGVPHDSLFAHHWYLACDDVVNADQLRDRLDLYLKELNDDYAVERNAALKEVFVTLLPTQTFYDFMKQRGKVGGQSKFPRVLKKQILEDWNAFLADKWK
ncbi:GH3 family domain-containing protein [Peijinzhouia sedimentorum]